MIYLSREGRPEVRPTTVTVNCVLDVLAKNGDASRAEALLDRMEEQQYSDSSLDRVRLNVISYTSVLDAYAKSGTKGSAHKAEEIFHRMEQAYANGNKEAKPNAHSFNSGTSSDAFASFFFGDTALIAYYNSRTQ